MKATLYRRKIISADAAVTQRAAYGRTGKSVVFTNGCFDILHPGHVDCLARARVMGDVLFVGLNSDRSVRAMEKEPGRPVNEARARAEVLAGLESVSHVVIFDEDTPENLIAKLQPDVLVKGSDWQGKTVAGAEHAGRVSFVPLLEGYSTTATVRKIRGDGG